LIFKGASVPSFFFPFTFFLVTFFPSAFCLLLPSCFKIVKKCNQKEVKEIMTGSQPTQTPKLEEPKFGFNEYAERLNGRAAMIGFVLTLLIEYLTGQGLLSWLGLQ